jgi:aminopeptidase-like protein
MFINKIYKIAKEKLFYINRSITGKGVRDTLNIFKKNFPNFKIRKIKSGSKVFDWVVPPEWNVKEAYIEDNKKKKIIDFKENNLHLVGYSIPINKFFKKKNLIKHIYSIKKKSNAIPYITSYYKKYWGFCITDFQKKKIISNYKNEDKFKVVIKSKLNDSGMLNYGELIIKGNSKQEILISTYVCHPSMANNELSGPIVSLSLIDYFLKKKLQKTLRFIFIPETIGSIAYLSKKINYLKRYTVGGFNLTCIGDEANFSCIFSKYGNTQSDKVIKEVFKKYSLKYKKYSFLERGSDERQFNSPGVDLPIATISRSKFHEYPEYHTSLDNFDLVTLKGIKKSFKIVKIIIETLLKKKIPQSKHYCEPNLSKRRLYSTLSRANNNSFGKNILNFLQYSDGKNSLKEISKKIKINIKNATKIYNILKKNNLIIN